MPRVAHNKKISKKDSSDAPVSVDPVIADVLHPDTSGQDTLLTEGNASPELLAMGDAAAGAGADPGDDIYPDQHAANGSRYFEAVGRRKTAVARARMFTRAGTFVVNTKPHSVYFPTQELQRIVEDALKKMKLSERFRISIKVSGGGSHSQAEAVRHALARCLIKFNPDFRKRLKRAGFLTRDPRAKERKKFGLKKARRAPQWQKR